MLGEAIYNIARQNQKFTGSYTYEHLRQVNFVVSGLLEGRTSALLALLRPNETLLTLFVHNPVTSSVSYKKIDRFPLLNHDKAPDRVARPYHWRLIGALILHLEKCSFLLTRTLNV